MQIVAERVCIADEHMSDGLPAVIYTRIQWDGALCLILSRMYLKM